MAIHYSEEAAQREAQERHSFLRVIPARRPGTCPACQRPIKAGDEVGVTFDRAWRCRECAEVMSLLGPRSRHLLDLEERKIDARRIEIVRETHPIVQLWKKCEHRSVVLVDAQGTEPHAARCSECGARMTRRIEGGAFIYTPVEEG